MHNEAELPWLSAAAISAGVNSGELDPQAVVTAHLGRIKRVDRVVHAFVHIDEDAVASSPGELAGVTVAVKDTQPVRGMPWTSGSRRWRHRLAQVDSVAVRRIRSAGAALVGKVNTPELAASISTVNEIFPDTENPWKPRFTPGGSSGGSAAAVAAGLVTIALGDDFSGSIRVPASCCGVIGFRPTPGRVPSQDSDPSGLNSQGPLTRSVADARLLFSIISAQAAVRPEEKQLRIAYALENPYGVEQNCQEACRRAVAALRNMDHSLTPISWNFEAVTKGYHVVRPVSIASVPGSLDEFGPSLRPVVSRGRATSAIDYYQAHKLASDAAYRLVELLDNEFDAIVTPAVGLMPMPIASVPRLISPEWDQYTAFVLPVAFSRLPAVVVPAGLYEGLPTGVQIVCRRDADWQLLALAEGLEETPGFGFQRPDQLSPMR